MKNAAERLHSYVIALNFKAAENPALRPILGALPMAVSDVNAVLGIERMLNVRKTLRAARVPVKRPVRVVQSKKRKVFLP